MKNIKFIITLMCFVNASLTVFAQKELTLTSDAKVRTCPDPLCKEATIIKAGEKIKTIALVDGYYSLKMNDTLFYINELYFEEIKPEAIHSNSNAPSNTYPQSDKVIKTGPKGGHYYINKNGNKTYIRKK